MYMLMFCIISFVINYNNYYSLWLCYGEIETFHKRLKNPQASENWLLLYVFDMFGKELFNDVHFPLNNHNIINFQNFYISQFFCRKNPIFLFWNLINEHFCHCGFLFNSSEWKSGQLKMCTHVCNEKTTKIPSLRQWNMFNF